MQTKNWNGKKYIIVKKKYTQFSRCKNSETRFHKKNKLKEKMNLKEKRMEYVKLIT